MGSPVVRVRDVMKQEPRLCTPEDSLATAGRIMGLVNCGVLPILTVDSGQVVGVITDRDICVALATGGRRASEVRVRQAMSNPVHVCHPDDALRVALDKMRKHKVRRLVVVAGDGQLRGILALDDVALEAKRATLTGVRGPEYTDVAMTLKAICEPPEPLIGSPARP